MLKPDSSPPAEFVSPSSPAPEAGPGVTPETAPTVVERRGAEGADPHQRIGTGDRALSLLLLAAERNVRIGLSVSVRGIVVSGTLIGSLAYYRALADQFASAMGGTAMDEVLAASFSDLVDEAAGVARGDRRHPPDQTAYERSIAFLHLEDARYIGPAGVLPQGRHGVLWRCAVSEVSSWSLGDLVPR
jgi:hypothetical protein